jgi:cell division ATPase FtsA
MRQLDVGIQMNATYCALTFAERTPKGRGRVFHEVVTAPDRKECDIFNLNLADALAQKIADMERANKAKVKDVFFCVPLEKTKRVTGEAKIVLHPKSSRQVLTVHLDKALEQAKLLSLDWQYKPIHSFISSYTLDGKLFAAQPLGVFGRRLDIEAVFYVIDNDYQSNLDKFFDYINVNVYTPVLAPLAEAASFYSDELKRGTFALVNVGAKRCEFSYFKDFMLRDSHVAVYPSSLVERVAKRIGVSSSLAEDVLMTYGSFANEKTAAKQVSIKVQNTVKTFDLAAVCGEVTAFYTDVFKNVNAKMAALGESDVPAVLLGRWKKIPGADVFADTQFAAPLMAPVQVFDDKETALHHAGSWGAMLFERSKFNPAARETLSNKLITQLKNIWDEYF